MAAKKRTWYIGMVLVVLLVIGAGWMLLISPKRAETAEVRGQAESVARENLVLEKKVASLRADFAKIEELREAVRTERLRIPTDLELAELLESLDEAAAETEVQVEQVNFGTLQKVVTSRDSILLPSERAAAEKAKEAAETASTDASTDEPSAKPSEATSYAQPMIPGFNALQVTLSIVGDVESSLAFVDQLQASGVRNFMAGAFSTTVGGKGTDGESSDELMTTVIDGWYYVLESAYDPDAATAEPEAPADPDAKPELPGLGSRNPFTIPGTES